MKILTDNQEQKLLKLISKGIERIELENLVYAFVTNANHGDIIDAVDALYRDAQPIFQVWFRCEPASRVIPSFTEIRQMRCVYEGQFKGELSDDFVRLQHLKEVFTKVNWDSPHFECTDPEWEVDCFERELDKGDILVLKRGFKEAIYLVSENGLDLLWRAG